MHDKVKALLNEIKTEKKKKNKNFDKIKNLETEFYNIKYASNPKKLQAELKELNKIQFIDENLHEIKQELLQDYTGEFEMVGSSKVDDQIRQTQTRFRNISDYEAYINAIDEGYDAEDAIFNGYSYEINTPQFILVNRSDLNTVMDVILNMKLLNIKVIIVLYQQKVTVSLNVVFS